jgi:hypothetical protein
MQDDATLEDIDPPALVYVWNWFAELIDCRELGMSAGAILYQEIAAWAKLRAVDVSPVEVEALRKLDRAYLAFQYAKNNPDQTISGSLADVAEQAKMKREMERERTKRHQAKPVSR